MTTLKKLLKKSFDVVWESKCGNWMTGWWKFISKQLNKILYQDGRRRVVFELSRGHVSKRLRNHALQSIIVISWYR